MKDTIKKLQDKVANNAHFLYEALASLAGDNEQSKSNENFKFFDEKFEDPNSKSKIVNAQNYVMGVSSAAAEAKYTGLSAVCQQLYQNLSLLPTLEPTQRKSFGAIVENFPRLVSNYLYSPTKVDPCQQLVRILSNVQWAQPCPDSQLSVIRENFKKDAMNQEIDQTIETVDSSHQFVDNVFCTQKALVTNTIQGSSSFSKKKREPQNSKSKSKADLFNKIVEKSDALAVALNQIVSCETQSEAFLGGIEQYTNTIHSLWELAESLGLKGFQEVCTFINDNVFECSSQSQTMRFKQLEPLALWPKLLLDYLQTDDSGAKKLVEFLCQESMPISMSKSNGSRLLTQLLQEGTTRQFSNEPSPDVSSKDDDFATSIFDSQKNDLSTTTNNPKSHVSVNREQELEIVHCELETEPESASHFLTENSAIEKRLKILGGEDLKNSSTKLDEMSEKLPVQKMDLLPTTDSDITSSVQNLSQIPNPSTIELELSVQDSNPSFIELESSVQGGVAVESVNLSEIKTQLLVVPKDLSDEGRDSAQGIELSPEDDEKVSIKKAVETEQAIDESQALGGELLEPDGSEEGLPVDSVESIVTEELSTSHRQLSADDGNSPDEQFPIPDEGFPQEEPLDIANDVLELLIGQARSATEENAQIINELIEADEGSETLLAAVMTYTENVQAVADTADMAGLPGLTEVCAFINDNVMALGSQPKSVRFAAREVLSVWTEKVVAYLRHPAIETSVLVSVLTNAHWHQPLDIDAASQLQQRLLEGTTPVPNTAQINMPIEPSVSNDTGRLDVEPDVLELLIGQVRSATEENAQVLNELIEADEGSETLLTAVMTYTENVQAVADAAEMAGLAGLTEVCTFLNENVMALSGTVQSDRLAARELLETFFGTVVAYLQRPASASKVLVSFVLEHQWPTPLDKEAASLLLERLLERTTSEKNQAAAPVEECAKQGAAANESIELAAPDVLELVCSQITDSTEGLSAALEVCVSMENDNPAFLEAIEDYTNKVQEIWETAEMAGLSGLQEICTFVNDNLMAFAGLEQAAKTVAKTYFVGWPLSVLEYLHAPQIGAPSLVSFMQETGWPAPLEAEAANNLLILLTKPSYKESHEAQVSETPTNESAAFEAIAPEEILVHDLTPLEVSIVGDIPLGNAEGLEILIESLESTKEDLATELNKFMTHGPLDAGDAEALENYTELVQRLYTVFEMLGLEGLQTVCRFVIDNIKALSKAELAIRKKAKKVLETWPDLILSYVQSPTPSVLKLVNHLRQPMWTQPLTDEKAQALASQLVAGSTTEEDAEEAAAHNRQIQAQPEDVSLTIPEDINQELLDAYLQEAPQHAGEFSACIQNIIQEAETQEIERAQRIAHTLKGSSNIIGIKGIANIAHHLEDTLEYLAKHQVVPPKDLTDTMVEAADCLEIMVDALLGTDEPPPQALAVLQSVLDWANRIDQGKLDDASPPKSTPVAQTKATQPTSQPATESKAETKGKTATEVAAGTPEQFLRVPTKTIDELMRLVGELSISVGQIQEKLKHVIQSQRTLTEQDLILHKKTFELENLVDVRGITGIETNPKQALEETKDFDPLEFEQYNELHSVAHSFIESIADNRELAISVREDLASLETMFIHQERLNKEFQANIMTTRMVSVTTIVSKLQRNIRQTCRMTGKKAELDVIGTDILIDSDVLSNLADPLQHILRNAVDHGLESVDERAILGKPIEGSIKLSFYREGNNIVVKCEDDGQGLNYTNIRFTAIQRGLITENQELTEKELARLILMSGFSTKSGVTQVSGRGVGMDVVHTNIRQMKGTLDLLSETGKGTRILIKLPMTLVTVHVLLVRVGERRFGIPTNNLEQALAPGMAEFHKVGDEITLKRGKSFYGLKYLANLLSVPGDRKGLEDLETRPIILVHEETGITAVIVDELLDTHDLVMKNMGKYVKKIPGVAGASILGDGSLVPLLDLPELLRSSMQTAMGSIMAEPLSNDDVVVGTGNIPHIMIVDDSLSVRKSLSLLVEDAGFETLLAKDGLEAIEMMNQTRPNVMLVDMEMPRMNGLELTAHVRANQATQNLPIFMITSRTTEKHREQANTAGVNAYLTKPYQETQLLELIDKALAGQV